MIFNCKLVQGEHLVHISEVITGITEVDKSIVCSFRVVFLFLSSVQLSISHRDTAGLYTVSVVTFFIKPKEAEVVE